MGEQLHLSPDVTAVPKYGLKVKLNNIYPEDWSQERIPSLRQIWQISSLIFR